jgi:hypothetical protein
MLLSAPEPSGKGSPGPITVEAWAGPDLGWFALETRRAAYEAATNSPGIIHVRTPSAPPVMSDFRPSKRTRMGQRWLPPSGSASAV